MATAPRAPSAPREWNAGTYHRVSTPQFAWGQAVLDRLTLAGAGVADAIFSTATFHWVTGGSTWMP